MRVFMNGALTQASPAQYKEVLGLEIFKQPVSMWQSCSSGKGFYFKKDVPFGYLVKHIVEPELLKEDIRSLVNRIINGHGDKKELFGFCVATFNPAEDGYIRRSKSEFKTFTKLVQLDLDLKNEPNCTEEYVEEIINDIFEVSDLGKYILLCGKSISRKGIYLYLQSDTDNPDVLEVVVNKAYDLLNKIFKFNNPSKTLDKSVTDGVSRLRYYAPDKDLIINPNVQTLNTSSIKVKNVQFNYPITHVGNAFRELEIIRTIETRMLRSFNTTIYKSGFHSAFYRFACSCIGKGVSKNTLVLYTQQKYGQLSKQEDRENYLPELIRNIDCAEKFIQKNKTK
jgi:hypothetical protein